MSSSRPSDSGTLRKLNEATFPVHYSDKVRGGCCLRLHSPSRLTLRPPPAAAL